MSTVPLLARLVASAVSVSNKSANILREIKKSGELNVQEKGVNDYVTKADFLSQLNIVRSLEKMFPKMKFCGEEGVCTFYLVFLALTILIQMYFILKIRTLKMSITIWLHL